MKLRLAFLTRLNWIRDDRLEIELRFDQHRRLLSELLGFCRYDRERIPNISDTFTDTDHGWPIEDNKSMIVFARDVFAVKTAKTLEELWLL